MSLKDSVKIMYKLTILLEEHRRKHVNLLKRRFGFKSNEELVDFLISEKISTLF